MESEQSIFIVEYIMKNSYILVNMGPLANIDLIVSPLQRSASQTRRKNIFYYELARCVWEYGHI